MKYKTITYQRVLNLGNYENKKLELSAELDDGEDVHEAFSELQETTESQIRSELLTKIEIRIKELTKEKIQLIEQVSDLKHRVRDLNYLVDEYEAKLQEDGGVEAHIPFDQKSKISDDNPDPLSSFPEVSEPSNKNEYKRDWNQKIPNSNDNVDAF